MSTNLYLRGELRIKPGHEDAVEALRELVCSDEPDALTLNGRVLEIRINEDVPHRHYGTVWDALIVFVDEHCESAAAIQTGESEREFAIFGSDEAQREAAHVAYCNNEILFWETLRNDARNASRL